MFPGGYAYISEASECGMFRGMVLFNTGCFIYHIPCQIQYYIHLQKLCFTGLALLIHSLPYYSYEHVLYFKYIYYVP